MISELHLDFKEWPDFLPLVRSVLNNAPSPARTNVAPVTTFTGHEPTTPIQAFLRSKNLSIVTVSKARSSALPKSKNSRFVLANFIRSYATLFIAHVNDHASQQAAKSSRTSSREISYSWLFPPSTSGRNSRCVGAAYARSRKRLMFVFLRSKTCAMVSRPMFTHLRCNSTTTTR